MKRFSTSIVLLGLCVRSSYGFIQLASSAIVHHCPKATPNCGANDAALTMALPGAGYDSGVSPRMLVSQGMEAFRKGDIQTSIDLFDQADSLVSDGSLTPFLWQRGLSLYYADRFEDASKQVSFRFLVCLLYPVNPYGLLLIVDAT